MTLQSTGSQAASNPTDSLAPPLPTLQPLLRHSVSPAAALGRFSRQGRRHPSGQERLHCGDRLQQPAAVQASRQAGAAAAGGVQQQEEVGRGIEIAAVSVYLV